jgi:hypothetical protein
MIMTLVGLQPHQSHDHEKDRPQWRLLMVQEKPVEVAELIGRSNRLVPESGLGAFYAQPTLLKREVLPEHVAAAVLVLTAGELSLTTGLHIPVDAGVAAAFLR